jgi:hypothetical protein
MDRLKRELTMPFDFPAQRPAFGRPGIPPRWTSSSKDGVGTEK